MPHTYTKVSSADKLVVYQVLLLYWEYHLQSLSKCCRIQMSILQFILYIDDTKTVSWNPLSVRDSCYAPFPPVKNLMPAILCFPQQRVVFAMVVSRDSPSRKIIRLRLFGGRTKT